MNHIYEPCDLKKKFSNILVRCQEHDWGCKDLNDYAALLKTVQFELFEIENVRYFRFHSSSGMNFNSFVKKFANATCCLTFLPDKKGQLSASRNRPKKANASSSRAHSRDKERSPSRVSSNLRETVHWNASEAQKEIHLSKRLETLEAGLRVSMQTKSKVEFIGEKVNSLEQKMNQMQAVWNATNTSMQGIFQDFQVKIEEAQPAEDLETITVATFGVSESAERVDPEFVAENPFQRSSPLLSPQPIRQQQ